MDSSYSIGWSQDQHLFNKKIGVERPIHALKQAFPDNDRTAEIALLFYGGDFWDHEVSNADPDLPLAHDYIGWRLKSASKRGYGVRVLEGTKSHDRSQNSIWETINDLLDEPADLRYVDTVSIENHKVLGNILYVPDNWKPTANEVWEDVCLELHNKNLKKVDWVIMHGAFKHQLPSHLQNNQQLHDPELYSGICNKYVLVGHVHVKSQYKNIISIGSIERLSHNEEEPKGSLRINVTENGDEILFQENSNARIAKTIDLSGLTNEECLAKIHAYTGSLSPNQLDRASIRIKSSKTDPAYFIVDKLKRANPDIDWGFKDSGESGSELHIVRLKKMNTIGTTYDLSHNSVQQMLNDRIGENLTTGIKTKINELFKGYRYKQVTEIGE